MATVKSAPSPAGPRMAKRRPRFIIATPICDGHDVAAAAITRLLRREGVEAIYIGFNKSVHDIVKAAVEGGCLGHCPEHLQRRPHEFHPRAPEGAAAAGHRPCPLVLRRRRHHPRQGGPPRWSAMGVAKVYRPPLELGEAISDMVRRTEAAAAGEMPPVDGQPLDCVGAARLTAIELGHDGANGVGPADPAQPPTVWGINGAAAAAGQEHPDR